MYQNQFYQQSPGSYYDPSFPAAPLYQQRPQAQFQSARTYFVDGDIGAQSIPLDDGQSCFAIDKKRQVFYLRSLINGEYETHKYNLVEIFDAQPAPDFANQIQQLRDEIAKTNQRIDGLNGGNKNE